MIRNPDATTLNDIAIFFFDGENIPYTEEDPLANCSSREDFQNVVRLMGVLGRDDFLLFTERFVPLPGVSPIPKYSLFNSDAFIIDDSCCMPSSFISDFYLVCNL
jgi:hypothetical protein